MPGLLLATIGRHVTAGQVDKVRDALPKDIQGPLARNYGRYRVRSLTWPAAMAASTTSPVGGPMSLGLGVDLVSSSCPSPLYFRAHPAFAEPELYELFKVGDIRRTAPWPAPHGSAVGTGPD
jgi:hypothetical protein